MAQDNVQHVTDVKRRHERELLAKANVVAVGVGLRTRDGVQTNEVCIVVSVKVKLPAAQVAPQDQVPASLEGVPVDVIATGAITAF